MRYSTFLIYAKTNESEAEQVSSHVMLTARVTLMSVYYFDKS